MLSTVETQEPTVEKGTAAVLTRGGERKRDEERGEERRMGDSRGGDRRMQEEMHRI